YLRAWGLPNQMREEIADSVMTCVEGEPDISRAVIAHADRLLHARLNEMLGGALVAEEQGISVEERAAMLWGGLPELWRKEGIDPAALSAAYLRGARASNLSQHTQRPPETQPMTMETSLSHLPSLRMIGGWVVIIVVIVLAFIFTR
ncbi:MAG TPA: hypothetical protein VM680_12855, partial [Verrucomicrobiae bacterium]|nr:hypothetical protein [Verrucomicrobiae bacterium]